MKKIILILLVGIFCSCSKEEQNNEITNQDNNLKAVFDASKE